MTCRAGTLTSLNFLFCILVFCSVGTSQTDDYNRGDSARIFKARYHNFDLYLDKRRQPKQFSAGSLHFTNMRFDTTFIALNWRVPFIGGAVRKDKFNLTGGLADHLTKFYQYQYRQNTAAGEGDVICFIKEFSIRPEQDVLEHFFQNPSLIDVQDNVVRIDMECFYRHGDSLYPAMQFDTTYMAHYIVGQTRFTEAVEDMLQPFEDKLENLNVAAILKRKHYSKTMVWSKYTGQFNIPLLTASTFKKGIYRNIAELKSQMPSTDSFYVSLKPVKIRATALVGSDFSSIFPEDIFKKNTSVFLYDTTGQLINPSTVFAFQPRWQNYLASAWRFVLPACEGWKRV